MNSFVVGIKAIQEEKVYTLLLSQKDIAYLLLHIDTEKYDIIEIISTHSEKKDTIFPFCKVNDNLETGINQGEHNDC